MRSFVTVFLLAISATVLAAKEKLDDPSYQVRIWIEKFDGNYSQATGRCGSSYYCTIKVGKHEVTISGASSNYYYLSVHGDPEEPAYCCLFADKSYQVPVRVEGKLHIETLYYKLPRYLALRGKVEFGKIYIEYQDPRANERRQRVSGTEGVQDL